MVCADDASKYDLETTVFLQVKVPFSVRGAPFVVLAYAPRCMHNAPGKKAMKLLDGEVLGGERCFRAQQDGKGHQNGYGQMPHGSILAGCGGVGKVMGVFVPYLKDDTPPSRSGSSQS